MSLLMHRNSWIPKTKTYILTEHIKLQNFSEQCQFHIKNESVV